VAAVSTVLSPHSPSTPVTPPQFSSFRPASESEISKILLNCPNKQADSDPIPIWLLKKCSSGLVPTITNIASLFLSSGQFHPILKESTISPLVKKSTLDKDQLSNYRPVSACLSYPKSSNVLSNLDLLNTFLLTIISTLTSLHTVNITLLKLLLSIFMIISLMPVALRKYLVFVFLTCGWLLTPLITTS